MNGETFILLIIVGLAGYYLWRSFRGKLGGGCSCSCASGCSSKEKEKCR